MGEGTEIEHMVLQYMQTDWEFAKRMASTLNTVFTDLITMPSLMVSDTLKQVISLYDSTMIFKEIVLLDREHSSCNLYNLPILDKLGCLSDESILLPNHYGIEKAIMDLDKVQNHVLFKID